MTFSVVARCSRTGMFGVAVSSSSHADIGDMAVLRGILDRLCLQMGPLIAESYHEGGRAMIDNHHAVLAAVEPQDADAAERAIVADITEGGNMILERLLGRRAADTAKAG